MFREIKTCSRRRTAFQTERRRSRQHRTEAGQRRLPFCKLDGRAAQLADASCPAFDLQDQLGGQVGDVLATADIHCSADTSAEWHAIGAALAGSEEMGLVHQGLIDGYVRLFVSVLAPHSALSSEVLERRCVGLVGAGEALSSAMVRGNYSESEAAATLAALIKNGVSACV